MKASQLRVYTIGTVAANKPLDSKEIEFTPDEEMFFVNGELTDNAATVTSAGTNAAGQSYEKSLTTTSSMRAVWLPMGNTNRKTAPDVRRGERVVIYQFADADRYYWTTLLDDIKLRKLETVIYAFSNVREEDQEETADTTYFFEISTHGKYVHFHTSKNDGEPFAYDFQVNTGNGFVQIRDDVGNLIELDSANTKITAYNVDESYIRLDKKVIDIHALDSINITAGKTINLKAGEVINVEAGEVLNEKAPGINTESEETTNTVPKTTNTGTQTTIGLTTTGGLASVPTGGSTGGFSAKGDGIIEGSVEVTNNITAGNVVHGQQGVFPGGVIAPNV